MKDKESINKWIIETKSNINVGKNIIKTLKDNELQELWNDIKDYNKSGKVSEESKLYNLREYIAKIIGDNDFDIGYRTVIIPTIMEEIVKLHFNER